MPSTRPLLFDAHAHLVAHDQARYPRNPMQRAADAPYRPPGVIGRPGGHHGPNPINEVPDAERYGTPVPVELQAGEAVVFSDLLLHSSPPNTSPTLRRGGLTATYAPAELVPVLGRKTWAVLCSGEDAQGHWQIRPRPEGAVNW